MHPIIPAGDSEGQIRAARTRQEKHIGGPLRRVTTVVPSRHTDGSYLVIGLSRNHNLRENDAGFKRALPQEIVWRQPTGDENSEDRPAAAARVDPIERLDSG